MNLRKEYFIENGMPCNESGMFYESYVEWLENKINTSDNSEYIKSTPPCPRWEEGGTCLDTGKACDNCGS
jgi:hypothetical protein